MRNKFASISDPNSFKSCPGCRVHKTYDARFDGSRVVLEESGSFDIQERINSYAPYTDISYMLNRLSVGDDSVCSQKVPLYGDFSGFPDNPIDAINLYHNAESAFGRLDPDVKQNFNNDFRVWLASMLSPAVTVGDSSSGSEHATVDSDPKKEND